MTRFLQSSLVSLSLLAPFVLSGCLAINDYDRFQFGEADAGAVDSGRADSGLDSAVADSGVDGGTDGGGSDSGSDAGVCVAVPETCNGDDDDCDSTTDEEPTECSFTNGLTTCSGGVCAFLRCEDGFLDCDATAGCEVDRRIDVLNCGTCGRACGPTESCVASACTGPTIGVLAQAEGTLLRLATSPGTLFASGNNAGPVTLGGTTSAATISTDAVSFAVSPGGVVDFDYRLGGAGQQSLWSVGAEGLGISFLSGFFAGQPAGTSWVSPGGYLLSLNPAGVPRWSRTFEATGAVVVDVANDGTSIAMTAFSSGTIRVRRDDLAIVRTITSPECANVFRFNAAGNLIGDQTYDWCDGANGISLAPDGGFLLYGTLEGLGQTATFGTTVFTPVPGEWNPMVARFDASGVFMWGQMWNCDAGDGYILDAAFNGAGDVFLAGQCEGLINFGGLDRDDGAMMVRLNASGGHVWSRKVATGSFRALHIMFGSDGVLYLAGSGRGPMDFGLGPAGGSPTLSNHWVAGFTPADGTTRFGNVFAGSGSLLSGGLVETSPGRLVTALQYSDVIQVGGVVYTPTVTTTMFVTLDVP